MSFLLLQNHALSIKDGSASHSPLVIGDAARAFSGKPLSTRRSIKNTWSFSTPPLKQTYASFLIALLNGEGHTWSFDDTGDDYLYSSKGLGANGSTGANGVRYTTSTHFGDAAIRIAAASYVQFNVGYNFEWTAMVWTGTALAINTHYIVNSSGQKWVDGVRNDAASTPFITMTGGNFRLGDSGAGGFQYFDDLVLIPAKITEEFAVDFGTMLTAFGPLPKLRMRDESMFNNTYYVEGYEVSSNFVQGLVDGSWNSNLMEVSFSLEEHSRVN